MSRNIITPKSLLTAPHILYSIIKPQQASGHRMPHLAGKMTGTALRPLITVIGATGTGKSQLAVDLALALHGEIINADAMQMYEGLDIITNKMPLHERCGIRHHFLGVTGRDSEIRIGQWVGGVRRVIEEISGRGKLPILVGGTHYYIQALLFPHSCQDGNMTRAPAADDLLALGYRTNEKGEKMTSEELAVEYPILNGSTSQILEKLQEVDPVIAARWHPNDRRKIKRSLEIYYLNNCTPASEVYRRQQEAQAKLRTISHDKCSSNPTVDGLRNLIFWVHSDANALEKRLADRVDAMVSQGLFAEIQKLWEHYRALTGKGENVDLNKGVWQSIGFKEFMPYFELKEKLCDMVEEDKLTENTPAGWIKGSENSKEGEEQKKLDALKQEGLEKMKRSTVRYAKQQIKWIRIKLMNAIKEANDNEQESMISPAYRPSNILYLLDSTYPTQFTKTVSNPALDIARKFLLPFTKTPIEASATTNNTDNTAASIHDLPDPFTLSPLAASMLKPKRDYDLSKRPDLWVKRTCDLCNTVTVDEESWKIHVESGRHKRHVRSRKKRLDGLMWKEKREGEEREKMEAKEVGGVAGSGSRTKDEVDRVDRRLSLRRDTGDRDLKVGLINDGELQ